MCTKANHQHSVVPTTQTAVVATLTWICTQQSQHMNMHDTSPIE